MNYEERCSLFIIISRGLKDVATLLLQSGAQLNTPTGKPQKTTLHITVAGGHSELLKVLVKKFKADWKVSDDWGWTALHEAAVSGNKEMIRFLMRECRALINQKDKLGRTPLLLGLMSGIDEVILQRISAISMLSCYTAGSCQCPARTGRESLQ